MGASSLTANAAGILPSKTKFFYKDTSGKTTSAPIIDQYYGAPIVRPLAHVDPRLDPKLMRAATIADERSHAKSKARCWHYVKEALVASGAAGVNVEDVAIEHSPGQPVGLVELSVRPEAVAPLAESLRAAGWSVHV
jgi:hypothetical protein